MKHRILYLWPLLLLASLSLGACGGDDEADGPVTPTDTPADTIPGTDPDPVPVAYTVTTVDEQPQWQVNWSYNHPKPDWQMPSASDFDNWTVIKVGLEEALVPTATPADMLAVFIDDVLVGLSHPAVSLGTADSEGGYIKDLYLMKVFGNQVDQYNQPVTLKYYSDSLHQVFTTVEAISFSVYDEEVTTLTPAFTQGSDKYPLNLMLPVRLTSSSDVEPASGDQVAAFVEGECRGVATIWDVPLTDPVYLTVFALDSSEQVTLQYYHSASQRVFTFSAPVALDAYGESVELAL